MVSQHQTLKDVILQCHNLLFWLRGTIKAGVSDAQWAAYMSAYIIKKIMFRANKVTTYKGSAFQWQCCHCNQSIWRDIPYNTCYIHLCTKNILVSSFAYMDALVQDCNNPGVFQWSYCSLALSHQYMHRWTSMCNFLLYISYIGITKTTVWMELWLHSWINLNLLNKKFLKMTYYALNNEMYGIEI